MSLICCSGYSYSYTVTGLEPSSSYKYRLRVTSDHGNSEFSPAITVCTTSELTLRPPLPLFPQIITDIGLC